MPSPPNDDFYLDPKSDCVRRVEDLDLEALADATRRHGPFQLLQRDLSVCRASLDDDLARKSLFRRRVGDLVYVSFVTTAWMLGNILGALGCAVMFFIVISAGEWDAFFLQLDNLTSRYVAADLGRRGLFEHQLVQVFTLLIIVIALLRVPSFVRHLRQGLAEARVR
jgi:hypothetical protein